MQNTSTNNLTKECPKITFVVVARNDNYGENFLSRIQTFVKVLIFLTHKFELLSELIVVEYNPPENTARLKKELNIKDNSYLSVRFITIPKNFHESLENSSKIPLFEFIGKNIGIRGAKGEYIAAVNPDIIFSDKLFDYLSRELKPSTFYRVNRCDLSVKKFPQNASVHEILNECGGKVTKILSPGRTYYVSYIEWLKRFIHERTFRGFMLCPLFNKFYKVPRGENLIHDNAAGDFLLMHRDLWEKSCGYDEVRLGSAILDGYLLHVLYCLDVKQTIIPFPIYHMYHKDGRSGKPLASKKKYLEDTKKMLETKIPYKERLKSWGFPTENFQEDTIEVKN